MGKGGKAGQSVPRTFLASPPGADLEQCWVRCRTGRALSPWLVGLGETQGGCPHLSMEMDHRGRPRGDRGEVEPRESPPTPLLLREHPTAPECSLGPNCRSGTCLQRIRRSLLQRVISFLHNIHILKWKGICHDLCNAKRPFLCFVDKDTVLGPPTPAGNSDFPPPSISCLEPNSRPALTAHAGTVSASFLSPFNNHLLLFLLLLQMICI